MSVRFSLLELDRRLLRLVERRLVCFIDEGAVRFSSLRFRERGERGCAPVSAAICSSSALTSRRSYATVGEGRCSLVGLVSCESAGLTGSYARYIAFTQALNTTVFNRVVWNFVALATSACVGSCGCGSDACFVCRRVGWLGFGGSFRRFGFVAFVRSGLNSVHRRNPAYFRWNRSPISIARLSRLVCIARCHSSKRGDSSPTSLPLSVVTRTRLRQLTRTSRISFY
jgi:hypothetical protein